MKNATIILNLTVNTRGPTVAGVIHRPKAKQAQRVGSWGANPLPLEEKSNKFGQGGRDQEAKPCMFTGSPFLHFTDEIHFLLNAQTII